MIHQTRKCEHLDLDTISQVISDNYISNHGCKTIELNWKGCFQLPNGLGGTENVHEAYIHVPTRTSLFLEIKGCMNSFMAF